MTQLTKACRKGYSLGRVGALTRQASSYSHSTLPSLLPIKAGTPIKGLDFFKGKDAVVALERTEYPGWVDRLATPPPSLAKLRRMPDEEADDKLQKRFLKLKRRAVIKTNNRSLAKS